MAEISAGLVRDLREKTGAGMMDCKKALVEAGGDMDKAADLLRERGIAKAGKRAGRTTSEGRVIAMVAADGKSGALVELNCETDFVAKTDDYEALGSEFARRVCENDPADVNALLALSGEGGTLNDQLIAAIARLGENIQVRRIGRLSVGGKGTVSAYVHAGGKIGTLVAAEAPDAADPGVRALTHNVCMHVAAVAPSSLSRDDLPAALVDKEREILTRQAKAEGKPDNIIDKMVEGRITKFFKEVVLLEQPLVMDAETTVGAAAKKVGATISGYKRFQLGEELSG